MEYTWPSDDQTYSRPTSQVPIGTRGIACSLLVPEANEPNAEVDRLFSNFDNWDSHDPEQYGDTKVP